LEGERLLCINRSWTSDIRLSNLYRNLSSYIAIRDVNLMESDPDLTYRIFRSRIKNYLSQSMVVNDFNREHGTHYLVGCGNLLEGGDYSERAYAQAFRKQMIESVVLMLRNGIIHKNFSAQNISISGEIGDWDSFVEIIGDEINLSDGFVFKGEVMRSRRAEYVFDLIKNSYLAQGLIDSVLGDDFVSMGDYWNMILEGLPEDHWVKNMSLEDLIEGSMTEKERQQDKYNLRQHKIESIGLWNRELKHLADLIPSALEVAI
jgi:hypothetical protein